MHEATGNALAIARSLAPRVCQVLVAHAKQVPAISHARVKSDEVDARVLADFLTADLIPAVWIGDERCRMLRRLVSRRRGLAKRRTQIKNEIAAVASHLKGRDRASDPFGKKGRQWVAAQQLPVDVRLELTRVRDTRVFGLQGSGRKDVRMPRTRPLCPPRF